MREPRAQWRARLAAEREKTCSFEGCFEHVGRTGSKGLCRAHYHQTWLDAVPGRREAYNAQQQRRQSKPEEKLRKRARLYGDVFPALWEKQRGLCAICASPMLTEGRSADSACVDHCHTTGRVRGLLHNRCNQALGLLRESSFAARAMARYIDRQEKP